MNGGGASPAFLLCSSHIQAHGPQGLSSGLAGRLAHARWCRKIPTVQDIHGSPIANKVSPRPLGPLARVLSSIESRQRVTESQSEARVEAHFSFVPRCTYMPAVYDD